jgi:hypothetical protein
MLIEETEKLYNNLAKRMIDDLIDKYDSCCWRRKQRAVTEAISTL